MLPDHRSENQEQPWSPPAGEGPARRAAAPDRTEEGGTGHLQLPPSTPLAGPVQIPAVHGESTPSLVQEAKSCSWTLGGEGAQLTRPAPITGCLKALHTYASSSHPYGKADVSTMSLYLENL